MVQLKGPALGLSAGGSIGRALIFSTWKGTAYRKKKAAPTDTRTADQQLHDVLLDHDTQTRKSNGKN